MLILTFLGCVIPAIYLNIFSEGYLLYRGWPAATDLSGIFGVICIIGFLTGIIGFFNSKNIYKSICVVCVLLCFAFILYAIMLRPGSPESRVRFRCSSNLKLIYAALAFYAMDYEGYYPPANGAAGLEMLRKNHIPNDYRIYTCPGTQTLPCKGKPPLTEENVDYVYIGGLNTQSNPKQPLMYDKANNHGYYGNVLFADGTVEGIYGNPWTQNIKK